MNTHIITSPKRSARVISDPIRTVALRDRVGDHVPPPLTRFEQAFTAVREDDRPKQDYTALRHHLVMNDGALVVRTPDGEEERLRPTHWASGQLCTRLGIPGAYFAGCPSVLQDVQANFWLANGPAPTARRGIACPPERGDAYAFPQQGAGEQGSRVGGEQWLLRARGESLRAVLSSTYSPLDNGLLMETLAPLVDSRLRVDWFALSDETLHLRLVDPSKTRELLPSDALSVGVHISNSEVGARSLCVDALVYRLVCSNGLIALVKGQSLLKRRHVHMAPLRFQAALAEAVESAFVTAEGFLEQLRDSIGHLVPDPEHAIEKLGERWGLSESVREAAKVALWRESRYLRPTTYALVNAFTGVAQLLPGDKRYDLEVLAGQLAQSGVPAYALAPREKQIAVTRGPKGREDVVSVAQKSFDAQVVSRRASVLGASVQPSGSEVDE